MRAIPLFFSYASLFAVFLLPYLFISNDANAVRVPVEQTNGYVDPDSGLFVGIGELVNDGFSNYAWSNVTVNFAFGDGNGTLLSFAENKAITTTSTLPIKGGFNVPPFAKLPFKVILNNSELAGKVKYFGFAGGGDAPVYHDGVWKHNWKGIWKPADLIVSFEKIEEIIDQNYGDSNASGNIIANESMGYKKWAIKGTIFNNYNGSTSNVYVVAGIYDNKSSKLIGVAGYSPEDKQPLELNGLESKNFTLYATIPKDFRPDSVYLYAESDTSSMVYPYYLPIISEHGVDGVSFSQAKNIVNGDTVTFYSNLTNISRKDLEFEWILQIVKLSYDERGKIIQHFTPYEGYTEHIEIIHSSVVALGNTSVQYSWHPSSSGYYASAIYIWDNVEENPIQLSRTFPYMHRVIPYPHFSYEDFIFVR